MVEVAKAALGITNPAMELPVVCDSCLSPSKLGETAKSLNLPNLKIIDISQSKVQPSGIKTNPRMKNPMLNTLRDTMFEFTVNAMPNINERINENESFDSVLSPSKACDWLSGETFEYSSEDESQYEDPRMIKIKPQIKTKSSRSQSEGHHDFFEQKIESIRRRDRVFSCQEQKSEGSHLEIGFPLHSVPVKPDISGSPAPKMFRVSSSKFPFSNDNFPIVAPPSPFRTALKNSTNNLIREVASKTSLAQHARENCPKAGPGIDGGQNMIWDSTFEAIKTLETSMKLKLTPQCERVARRMTEDRAALLQYEESDNSKHSVDTPNKSDHSNLSLAWDNTGHFLESKLELESEGETKDCDSSSGSSVDIEEIIHRVAPNLSRCEFNQSHVETERKQTSSIPAYLRRHTSYSGTQRVSDVVSSPLLHQTVYLSVASLDTDDEDNDVEDDLKSTLRRSPSKLHSSPNCTSDEQTKIFHPRELPSPIQFCSATSLLTVSGASSLPSSPKSFQTEDYMSTCSSLDSYKTIIFDNITDYV